MSEPNYSNSSPMKVKVLATRNRVDGSYRTAVALRLRYSPMGVEYDVSEGPVKLPPTFNGYDRSWRTALTWTLRFLTQPLTPVRGELIHSFFLDNLYVAHGRWIVELDQPISTFLSDYGGIKGPMRWFGQNLFKFLNSRAKVITWTRWSEEGLHKDGFDQVYLVPPPMEIGHRRPHLKPTILFVGLDFERKGGAIAELVFQKLGQDYRKIWIGKPRATLRGVEYLPPLPRGKLRELMMESDLLLFPSQVEAYGFTMLEAMSLGVPVVSSDYGSLPETLEGGGLICGKDEWKCFLESSLELLESPELNRKFGSWARAVVEWRHSPSEVGRKLVELYSSVLEQ